MTVPHLVIYLAGGYLFLFIVCVGFGPLVSIVYRKRHGKTAFPTFRPTKSQQLLGILAVWSLVAICCFTITSIGKEPEWRITVFTLTVSGSFASLASFVLGVFFETLIFLKARKNQWYDARKFEISDKVIRAIKYGEFGVFPAAILIWLSG